MFCEFYEKLKMVLKSFVVVRPLPVRPSRPSSHPSLSSIHYLSRSVVYPHVILYPTYIYMLGVCFSPDPECVDADPTVMYPRPRIPDSTVCKCCMMLLYVVCCMFTLFYLIDYVIYIYISLYIYIYIYVYIYILYIYIYIYIYREREIYIYIYIIYIFIFTYYIYIYIYIYVYKV